jgi:solute carrier family 36 (proton-coupled amino acid transporter)
MMARSHHEKKTVAFDASVSPSDHSSIISDSRRSYESFQEILLEGHKPAPYFLTLMQLLNTNIGSGSYAMAFAIKNSGIILGPILTLVIGVICVHAQHMLIECADFMREQNNLVIPPNVAETVEMCFLNSKSEKWRRKSSTVKTVCRTSLCVSQLGFCCAYVLFLRETLDDFTDHLEIKINMAWTVTALIFLWFTTFLQIKFMGKFSS